MLIEVRLWLVDGLDAKAGAGGAARGLPYLTDSGSGVFETTGIPSPPVDS